MMVERKLINTQCSDHEKVLYAAGQFQGATANWWEAYNAAHEDHHSIIWLEFKNSFRKHHVPKGTIKVKKEVTVLLSRLFLI